jgi:predicted aspartyl protease
MNPCFLSLACAAFLFLSISQADAQNNQPEPASSSAELPFRLSSDYLIQVEGRIGAQKNLKFILDTGASITIVDRKIADRLNLDRHQAQSFNFDRKLNWDAATLPDLQVGPLHATNITVFVGRLAEYSEFAKNVDGIIGMDLLKFTNLSIDFDSHKITFHPSIQKVSAVSGDPLSLCPILEVQVQGHPVRLIVDTGLAGMVLYLERLRQRVPGFRTIGPVVDATMGGRVPAKQATLPDVLFGKTNRDVSVLLVASPGPEMLPGIDGIIGIAALQAHRISFDFAARTLRWD